MQKKPKKLTLRKETLRYLEYVAGGESNLCSGQSDCCSTRCTQVQTCQPCATTTAMPSTPGFGWCDVQQTAAGC